MAAWSGIACKVGATREITGPATINHMAAMASHVTNRRCGAGRCNLGHPCVVVGLRRPEDAIVPRSGPLHDAARRRGAEIPLDHGPGARGVGTTSSLPPPGFTLRRLRYRDHARSPRHLGRPTRQKDPTYMSIAWIAIAVTMLLTVLLVVIALNFHRPEKSVRHRVAHCHAIDDPPFRREMDAMLGPDVLEGNSVRALQNGDEIFPALLEAIAGARHTITFETHIYWAGETGRSFAEALKERSRAGVAVHVMLDWVGSARMDQELLQDLVDAGVEVERYHPLRWFNISRLNNRTHRKLMVVDGRIGFTGGVGIADQWRGHAQDPEHWRDIHFRVEGPIVAQLQSGFMDNWIKTTGRVLHGDRYYPPLEAAGDNAMQLFVSSPAGGSASMHLMYLLAVTASVRSIDLQAAYFIPDPLMVDALIAARRRGVAIRLQVPGRYIDSILVRLATRRRWGELLEAGVQIFEYQPTMIHNKMLILDRALVSVGSTNFDMRSFGLNDEASLNIYSHAFAAQMTAVMDTDLRRARAYTLDMWHARPWWTRLAEWLLRPIESQL